jgi:hypothetical protein
VGRGVPKALDAECESFQVQQVRHPYLLLNLLCGERD